MRRVAILLVVVLAGGALAGCAAKRSQNVDQLLAAISATEKQPRRYAYTDVDAAGVKTEVDGIVDDPSDLTPVYNPGHPDADVNGFVLYPNVQIPIEMVNLITANRAYEANLRMSQAFRQQAEQALLLVRA